MWRQGEGRWLAGPQGPGCLRRRRKDVGEAVAGRLSRPVITEDCRGRGVASAGWVMDCYYVGGHMCARVSGVALREHGSINEVEEESRWDSLLFQFNQNKETLQQIKRLPLILTSENRNLHIHEWASRSMSCSLFKEKPQRETDAIPIIHLFIFSFFFFCLVTMFFSLSFVVPPSYNCTSSNDWAH